MKVAMKVTMKATMKAATYYACNRNITEKPDRVE